MFQITKQVHLKGSTYNEFLERKKIAINICLIYWKGPCSYRWVNHAHFGWLTVLIICFNLINSIANDNLCICFLGGLMCRLQCRPPLCCFFHWHHCWNGLRWMEHSSDSFKDWWSTGCCGRWVAQTLIHLINSCSANLLWKELFGTPCSTHHAFQLIAVKPNLCSFGPIKPYQGNFK